MFQPASSPLCSHAMSADSLLQTPIFHAPYSRERVHADDLMLSVDEVVNIAMSAICDSKYGDGNIIEVFCGGTNEDHRVCVRDVPLESLYDVEGMKGLAAGTHMLDKQDEFEQKLKTRGLEFPPKI